MTTPVFENKSEITLEKYLYLNNHPVGKKAKKKLKNWRMLQIFAMVVMAVNAFVCFYADALPIAVISVMLVAAFLCKLLFQRKRAGIKQYNQIIKNQENGIWYRTVTFGKDVKVTDGSSVTTFKYHEFVKFDEDERYYLLFKNENAVLRVEKGAFITGTDAEFVEFINKKIRPKKK